MIRRPITNRIFTFVIVALSLLACAAVVAQSMGGTPAWEKSYGGSGSTARSVQQTADGGYIAAGTASTTDNGSRAYMFKTGAGGTLQWQRYYGAGGSTGNAVQQTGDGGYILAGTTLIANGSRAYVVKTGGDGTVQWQGDYGVNGTTMEGNAIRQTTDGGYILAGTAVTATNGSRAYLARIAADGSLEWQSCYGENGSVHGNSVQQTADGGYILAGTRQSELAFGAGFQVYLAKVRADGSVEWQRAIGDPTMEAPGCEGNSVQQTADGGYIVAGTATYAIYDSLTMVQLIKTYPDGSVDWENWYGDYGNDYMTDARIGSNHGYSVVQTADGGYIVSGSLASVHFNDVNMKVELGSIEVYLVKAYANGTQEWQNTYGNGEGYAVAGASDGGYILAGAANPSNNGTLAYLAKVYKDSAQVPVAGFTSNITAGLAPMTIQFNDTSTGSPDSWLWDFGDGTPTVTVQNPDHTYYKPGTYTVSLTVANGGLASTASEQIIVRASRTVIDPRPGYGTFTNISSALACAADGDVIVVDSGYYRENLTVDKIISLVGQDTGNGLPVVDAGGAFAAINITAYNVSVSGFRLTGGYDGIYVMSDHNTLTNNRIYNNTYAGIGLYFTSQNQVLSNTIENNSVGIILCRSHDNSLTNNRVNNSINGIDLYGSDSNSLVLNKVDNNSRRGIYLEGSNKNSVSGNTANNDSNYGIALSGSSGNQIRLNTANDEFSGIYLSASSGDNTLSDNIVSRDNVGIYIYKSSGNSVSSSFYLYTANDNHYGVCIYNASNNIVKDIFADNNDHYGIYLYNSSDNSLSGNTVANNTLGGIVLYGSGGNQLSENTAHNDHYGLYLYYSSANTVSGNTADNNSYDGIVVYSSNANSISGNVVRDNCYGLYVRNSSGNVLWSNTISHNSRSVYASGGTNTWNSTAMAQYSYGGRTYQNYTGNYWSDYHGQDGNTDGIGDTPYEIDPYNQDRYPLLKAISGVAGEPVYVTEGQNTFAIIDGRTGKVTRITVGDIPMGVAVDRDRSRVYVANAGSGTVSVIDGSTAAIMGTMFVGNGSDSVAVSPNGARLYVVVHGYYYDDYGNVSAVDTTTGKAVATVPVGKGAQDIAISPDGSKLYVTNRENNSISIINSTTMTVSATRYLGADPYGVAFSPDGTKAYVTHGVGGAVTIVNATTDTVKGTINVKSPSTGVAFSPDGSRAYIANDNNGTISVIDTTTDTVSGVIRLPIYYPYYLAVSRDGTKLYITNELTSDLTVVDTATNAVSGSIFMGQGTHCVATG